MKSLFNILLLVVLAWWPARATGQTISALPNTNSVKAGDLFYLVVTNGGSNFSYNLRFDRLLLNLQTNGLAPATNPVFAGTLTLPSTLGTNRLLYINGSGQLAAVTSLSGLTFTNGTLAATGGGLFAGGVLTTNLTNFTSSTLYASKLVVNNSADAATDIKLMTDATDGLTAGAYFYLYFPSATIGGSITAEPGATVTRFGSGLTIGGQYALVKCYKVAVDTWFVEGDLTIP